MGPERVPVDSDVSPLTLGHRLPSFLLGAPLGLGSPRHLLLGRIFPFLQWDPLLPPAGAFSSCSSILCCLPGQPHLQGPGFLLGGRVDAQSASGLPSIRRRSPNLSPRGTAWESASPAGTTPQCPAFMRSPEDEWNGQRNARERKKGML